MGAASSVTNIVIAGLGGHGVLKASDIVAEAALRVGRDVKKSEIHGMSQRGGSVTSDVRFGREVLSPMVPPGEADYLVVLAEDQVAPNEAQLRNAGVLIHPGMLEGVRISNKRTTNVALLGVLSAWLDIPPAVWIEAIHAHLPSKFHTVNLAAFETGRAVGTQLKIGGKQ